LGLLTDSLGVLVPAVLLGIPLSAIAGYYAGKLLDTSTTRLLIQEVTQAGNLGDGEAVDYEIQ
jgi:ABC-type dipeptide/oligopeptide/nickel transport system permease subunit